MRFGGQDERGTPRLDIPHRSTIAAALVGLSLAACGDPHMEWNEQVKLQSGEVIVVARTAKFSENWIAGGGGGMMFNKGMTLQIVQPAKPDNPTPWGARFVPIVFDRDPATQEWFIVGTFFSLRQLVRTWPAQAALHRVSIPQRPMGPAVADTGDLIGRGANVLPARPVAQSGNCRDQAGPDHQAQGWNPLRLDYVA